MCPFADDRITRVHASSVGVRGCECVCPPLMYIYIYYVQCTCAREFVSFRAGKSERGLRVTTRGERLYVRTVAYIATSEKVYGRIRIQTMSPFREIVSPPFFSPLRLTPFSVVLFFPRTTRYIGLPVSFLFLVGHLALGRGTRVPGERFRLEATSASRGVLINTPGTMGFPMLMATPSCRGSWAP